MALPEADFQKQVLASIEETKVAAKDGIAKALENYENLQKETKKTMEELTLLKNNQGDTREILAKIQKFQMQVRNEARAAFGNPARKLCADYEVRNAVRTWFIRGLGLEGSAKKLDDSVMKKDLTEGSTPGSIYVLPHEVEQMIYDALLEYGAYKTLDVRTISAIGTEVPVKTARVLFQFGSEGGTITPDTNKAGTRVVIIPLKMAAMVLMSSELLQDAALPLMADLMNDFGEGFGLAMDTVCFTGQGGANSGANNANDGAFTGIFNAGTVVTAASATTVGAMTYLDVLQCLTGVAPVVLERSARWWGHPTMIASMIGIKDSNGRPIWQSILEAPSFGGMGSILGYPVTLTSVAPSTNSAAKPVIAFGDPNGYAARIRRDLTIDRSDHFKFNTDEIAFRATARVGGAAKVATAFTVLNTHA